MRFICAFAFGWQQILWICALRSDCLRPVYAFNLFNIRRTNLNNEYLNAFILFIAGCATFPFVFLFKRSHSLHPLPSVGAARFASQTRRMVNGDNNSRAFSNINAVHKFQWKYKQCWRRIEWQNGGKCVDAKTHYTFYVTQAFNRFAVLLSAERFTQICERLLEWPLVKRLS